MPRVEMPTLFLYISLRFDTLGILADVLTQ